MKSAAFLALALLAGCGGAPAGGTSSAAPSTASRSAAAAIAQGGLCPTPDPVRDGPLVDAIRTSDAATLRSMLARDPDDGRVQAALTMVEGGRPEANDAACFAPYLS